jgi:hypothetical protein
VQTCIIGGNFRTRDESIRNVQFQHVLQQ